MLLIAAALLAGCAADAPRECQTGADCPSGACDTEGRCVDGASGGAGAAAGGGGSGGEASLGGGGSGQGGSGLCSPNGDGVIEETEITLAAGLSAKVRAAQDATVDSGGEAQGDGSRLWDFSAALPGDHALLIETLPLAGAWYEAVFASATYAARLSDSEELLGVFEAAPGALLLRGVVSPEGGLTRTELVYDPPVKVIDFPLEEGKSWQSHSVVSGLALGVATFYQEDYLFEVDAHGEVVTPYGSFQALRVHSRLVRTVAALPITIQSHAFMAECFGNVASISSHEYEQATEFSSAAEIRRLTP